MKKNIPKGGRLTIRVNVGRIAFAFSLMLAACLSVDIIWAMGRAAHYVSDLSLRDRSYWAGRKYVQINSPLSRLPAQLPGPEDSWAGGEPKELRISAPFARETRFVIRFLESHESIPPTLEVKVNGQKMAELRVPKGTGLPRAYWPYAGKTSTVDFLVPSKLLSAENTIVSIRSIAGSWAVIETIVARPVPATWKYVLASIGWFVALAFAVMQAVGWLTRTDARQLAFTTVLLCIGSLVGIMAGEVLVRALDVLPRPLDPLPVQSYRLSENPVILYEYKPGMRKGTVREGTKPDAISTNLDGFRDRDYTVEKPANTVRIIVLGDSTSAGVGVNDGRKIYTELLEKLMNEKSNGPKFEVLNMGVGGYQTLQEMESLRVKGLKYDPDYVITLFCTNDFWLNIDGGVYKSLVNANPGYEYGEERVGILNIMLSQSRLAFVAYHRIKSLVEPPSNFNESVNEYKEKYLKGKTTVEVGMEMLSQMQEREGFESMFVILPSFDRPFDRYRHYPLHDRVRTLARKYPGIDVVDTLEDFRAVNNNASVFSLDSLHKNEYGHEVLAGILLEKMTRKWFQELK